MLERSSRSRTESRQGGERARMVLGCVADVAVQQTAEECRTRPNTVMKWRNRFVRLGLLGLQDSPRPGAKRKYNKSFRNRVLEKLELPPPGQATWDGPSLARENWRFGPCGLAGIAKRGDLPATATFVVGPHR